MSFDFSIFEAKAPTEEELRQSSADWLSRIGPTLIDQWPADLLGLSIPTIFIPMPQNCTGLYEPKTFHSIADDLARQIDDVIGWDRKFFRLNSRSPKDAVWPFEVLASCSGKEIMSVIASSERCLEDFSRFAYAKLPPVLCLRDFWWDIRPEYEFRCFVTSPLPPFDKAQEKGASVGGVNVVETLTPPTSPPHGGAFPASQTGLRQRLHRLRPKVLRPISHWRARHAPAPGRGVPRP